MTLKYTISRDALKRKAFKEGAGPAKEQGAKDPDLTALRPLLIKILTSLTI